MITFDDCVAMFNNYTKENKQTEYLEVTIPEYGVVVVTRDEYTARCYVEEINNMVDLIKY